MSIIVLIAALVGVLVMFNVSAIFGLIIYGVAFIFSLHNLKSKVDYDDTFSILKFIKRISKNNLLEEGIYTIIVACLPLVLIAGAYCWIVLDTVRFVNSLF